jgi:hypothetical protein
MASPFIEGPVTLLEVQEDSNDENDLYRVRAGVYCAPGGNFGARLPGLLVGEPVVGRQT